MRDLPDWDPEYQAKREANLKRWGLLPPGKGIETRRVA
jgi:hypothetical protein